MSRPVLTAYEMAPVDGVDLAPGPPGRDWMDSTYERLAYKCLPMLVANQSGWLITCPASVRVMWDGGPGLDAVRFERRSGVAWHPDPYLWPSSQFGEGIVTFIPPFLFRTPPGWNLLVRGPANCVKDGVQALEGVVEADWTSAMFTMNWKITRPDVWVAFERGEPVCMVVPQRRGELEEFAAVVRPISDDPGLLESHGCWRASRREFDRSRRIPESEAARKGWEKHYMRGTSPDGLEASGHQTRLRLSPFTRVGC